MNRKWITPGDCACGCSCGRGVEGCGSGNSGIDVVHVGEKKENAKNRIGHNFSNSVVRGVKSGRNDTLTGREGPCIRRGWSIWKSYFLTQKRKRERGKQ